MTCLTVTHLDSEMERRVYAALVTIDDTIHWIAVSWRWRNNLWWQYRNRRNANRLKTWSPCHAGFVW